MRRLDLCPQKKLRNPGRHIRSLEKWSRSFEDFFPSPDMAYKGLWYNNIPIYQKVVSPPRTNSNLQKQCAQLMIEGALRLCDARPEGLLSPRIYVFLSFPDMFYSMVEVAFEPNPHLFFNSKENLERQGDDHNWWEYFKLTSNRIDDLGLRIPDGFNVLSTGLRRYDADWMSEPEVTEEWVIGEVTQA